MSVIDYGSGVAAEYIEKTLFSKVGLKGIVKKVMIICNDCSCLSSR
ncbi:phage holin family protein [[Anoxybacillus] calidus]|jgi:phage-related holin